MKWNFRLLFYSIILKSMILWFVIFEFGLRTSAYEFARTKLANSSQNVWHSVCGQNMQISTVDVIRCVKPSSHHSIWGELAKEWEVFRYWRACFSELQSTTYTEGTVFLIFSEDEVRRAHCYNVTTAQRRMRPCCPSISDKVSIDGF